MSQGKISIATLVASLLTLLVTFSISALATPPSHIATLSIADDGLSFTWDGPPALSHYTISYCDDTTGDKVETPNAPDDSTITTSKAIAQVVAKGGTQELTAIRKCNPVQQDQRLTLTSICHIGDEGKMRLINPNAKDIAVEWSIYPNPWQGPVTAMANAETFFTVPWPGTVKIKYSLNDDVEESTKAQNNTLCDIVQRSDFNLVPKCKEADGRFRWEVINKTDKEYSFTIYPTDNNGTTATGIASKNGEGNGSGLDRTLAYTTRTEGGINWELLIAGFKYCKNANTTLCYVEPPTDVCVNIDGIQTEIPEGYYDAGDGYCEKDPEPTTNPEPTTSPEPTTNPTPSSTSSPDPKSGKRSALGKNGPTCEDLNFEVTYDLKEDGDPRKDIEVTLSYNGDKKTLKTDDGGRARTFFAYNGEGTVEAKNNSGYPEQSLHIDSLDCPSVGGVVLGTSSSTPTDGKVLGDSTSVLAATGTFSDTLALTVRMVFGFMIGLISFKALQKKEIIA